MPDDEAHEKLLFQHEVLRTRLMIREYYLGAVVKEVYENIGQVLSLIRLKLSALKQASVMTKEEIESSGELVEQILQDLRILCRFLYPEERIINVPGFYTIIAEEIKKRFPRAKCRIEDPASSMVTLGNEKVLLLFGILLEILGSIEKHPDRKLISLIIIGTSQRLIFTINYSNPAFKESIKRIGQVTPGLAVFERAGMLKGRIQIKCCGSDRGRIKLEVPIN